jgi:ATP-dependent DNA ligase
LLIFLQISLKGEIFMRYTVTTFKVRLEVCDESRKRSGTWLKYKIKGGYTPGNPFDALIVGYYEGDKLHFAAKLRNGFVPRVRQEVYQRFKGLETDTCPFTNLPEKKRTQWALTKEEMKNCVWLKPKLVAQIEFTEWTPDNHVRHSKFVGTKADCLKCRTRAR